MRAIPYIAKLRRLNITAIQSGKPTDRRLFLQEVYVCSRRRNTRGITRYLEISTGNKVQDTVSCIKTLLPKVSSDDRRLVWRTWRGIVVCRNQEHSFEKSLVILA